MDILLFVLLSSGILGGFNSLYRHREHRASDMCACACKVLDGNRKDFLPPSSISTLEPLVMTQDRLGGDSVVVCLPGTKRKKDAITKEVFRRIQQDADFHYRKRNELEQQ